MSSQTTPSKFLNPANLFKNRRRPSGQIIESPLRCVNDFNSPAKKLPTVLKNPFSAVKRRLDLQSPRKSGFIDFNEDANLDAPPPPKKVQKRESCFRNDWTLRTRMKIKFDTQCNNWDKDSSTTHRRISAGVYCEESPCKANDNSISIEAIKNVATVYQHPYLAWLPLFPRVEQEEGGKTTKNPIPLSEPKVATKMLEDWCESFDDLINLLIRGRCPYFYLCSHTINILFKSIPSSNPRRPTVQAFISPFQYAMGLSLTNLGVEFTDCELSKSNSSSNLCNTTTTIDSASQHSFGSNSQTVNTNQGSQSSKAVQSSQATTSNTNSKYTPSNDSGNVNDEESDDDWFYKKSKDEPDDHEATLDTLGLSIQGLEANWVTKRAGFAESEDSLKPTRKLPLVKIEGTKNVLKLVEYLQTNNPYTISKIGKFAFIPPTLLAPREFRLCTPHYPDVVLSKNMIENLPPHKRKQSSPKKHQTYTTPKKNRLAPGRKEIFKTPDKAPSDILNKKQQTEVVGPTFVELKGTILPTICIQLHKLLSTSENANNHSCSCKQLDSSQSFGNLPFHLI